MAADFDGDGFDDLAVGVPNETVAGVFHAGAVHVIYGSPAGLSATDTQFIHQNSTGISDSAEESDQFGLSLAAADFGNGVRADLAIGVPRENVGGVSDAGAVHVVYGSASGLGALGDQLRVQSSGSGGGLVEANDHFGWSLAAANFGNGSQADLAVGVPGEDVGAIGNAGAVNVVYGASGGLTATGAEFRTQDAASGGGGVEAGDDFGVSLAAANFGKGTQADLAVGVLFEDLGGALDAGAVNVIYGSSSGLTESGNQFWHQALPLEPPGTALPDPTEPDDQFGWWLAAANFGNGAQADLAVGVPLENVGGTRDAGAVDVIFGSATGLTVALSVHRVQNAASGGGGVAADDEFGFALAF